MLVFWFLQSIDYSALAQSSIYKSSIGGSVQLSFEQQSYIENGYHNSRFVDIEKNAGICLSYNIDFFQGFLLKKNLLFDYTFGYKWNNQESDFTEIVSSDFDYLEMGLSQIKSGYLCFSLGVSYKSPCEKRIYFVPHISIGSNFLATKEEKLIPLKTTFDFIQNPYSTFYSIVPEVAFDFLLYYNLRNLKYKLFFGPSLKNNLKYYHEEFGTLAAPISFCLKLGISKTK